MTPPPPISLALVTGPRGSGKTRLINAALSDESFANTLALTNESGGTSLARPALEVADVGLLDRQGCLCCSGRGRFATLLESLLRALDNRRIPPFDRLIVETAGDADPAPLLAELIGHPYLGRRYTMHGVIVVLPARMPEESQMLARQLAWADAVVTPAALPADLPEELRAAWPEGVMPIPAPLASAEAAALLSRPMFTLERKPEALRRSIYAAGLGSQRR